MSDGDNRRALEGRLDCCLNKLISLLIYIRGGLVDANDLRTINEYRVIGNARIVISNVVQEEERKRERYLGVMQHSPD